ncbi:uncharacterized protein LOC110105780 [Dendrobium catenatum]|uniref:uncharacterized protein LOC110105780 n=1 Tax=Dendrobium catenatum TaxID=906689 RepID=UPI0009F45F63|nr:uncharacterized protein LOC110105780 [Dendrobium catenatum]
MVETKINSFDRVSFVRMMGPAWDFFLLPSEGISSGIMILWKSNMASFSVVKTSDQCVIRVLNVSNKGVWRITTVYGSEEAHKRRLLWECVQEHSQRKIPSIIGGDFNYILAPEDKKGARKFVFSQGPMDMIKFKNDNDYHEVGFVGPSFTWCNNKVGGGRILERLDRCILNSLAINKIQIAVVRHLARVASDQNPIVLMIFESVSRGRRCIRFEDAWLTFKTSAHIVSNGWKKTYMGDDMEILNKKCNRTLKDLKNSNCITQLRSTDGIMTEELKEVEEVLFKFFQNKWKSRMCCLEDWPKPWIVLEKEDKFWLDRELSVFEIDEVVLKLGNNKAPGCDEITYSFF